MYKEYKRVLISEEPYVSSNNQESTWKPIKYWAEFFSIPKSTLYLWVSEGLLEHSKIGRKIMINRSAIDEIFKRNSIPAWAHELEERNNQNE